ncbi:MAG: phosphatase domain-containing protein [Myxococcaceae bacterium]
MRWLSLGALLLAPVAVARPAVILFPAVGTPGSVTLSGRVLKHAPSSGSSKLEKNLRSLTSSNWVGAAVEVRYAGLALSTTSGHDGNFQVTFSGKDRPFAVGFDVAEAHVDQAEVGSAAVTIVATTAPFFVVSDFDDTLAVTHVVEGAGMLKAALLDDAKTHPVVEGMSDFYACLEEDQPARPGFALVSGSPAQYVFRVREFLSLHHFPTFGIYLRDLGPSTLSNYKQPVIRALMKELPNDAVMVGDSGEHDPEVYAQMRDEFPGRVKAIYIRDAGHADDAKRFEGMVLFKEPREAVLDALSKGLVSKACVERRFPAAPKPTEAK